MQTIKDKVEGDLLVSEEICLTGMVTGSISVAETGRLEMRGMCCKSLVVQKGGQATIHGMVNGDVVNRGGDVSIFGMVGGGVIDDDGGSTKVDSAAMIKKGRA
ncbi:MAG: hypothetical protein JNG86_00460 [Verrucomicrobiaceae bacterium]|nr:hypothetical protein [Verrucomicrobiaceae bacterium]